MNENAFDRVVRYFNPVAAKRRMQARANLAMADAYIGARTDRKQTNMWSVSQGDADRDILRDLPTLRARSRDLVRNTPLATGAINTVLTNVIGTGLRFYSRIDRDVLDMDEAGADAWESNTEREFNLWAESTECDVSRTMNFYAIQELIFRQVLECGEAFTFFPRYPAKQSPYDLHIQVIEPDRVCNKDNAANSLALSAGVEKDGRGAPKAYHILKSHPGSIYNRQKREWDIVPAYGTKTGLRNILHNYRVLRPGQTRGVPYLAPVIEPLKQLDRYTEAELMAAVVSGMFTVFIKSEGGGVGFDAGNEPAGNESTGEDLKLASGAIVGLAPGEDISTADPNRPNTAFDPFVQAILRQIGVALELPFEILIKHFTASYSAARAALLEAWKFFNSRRRWMADNVCQQIFEIWMYEAVSSGRISAPGFFNDRRITCAYLGSEWIGPARGMIDESKEIKAAQMRVDMGVSTLDEETAALTGGDWEKKHIRRVKENKMRVEGGLTGTVQPADTTDPPLPD